MSDSSDDQTDAPDPAPNVSDRLLALQALDSQSDLLTHRRERMDERTHFTTVTAQLADWERQRAAYRRRLDELDEVIAHAEAEGATTLAQRTRLEAQLKTVIAPREAEALMHEIGTINLRRDELDDVELAALEEQAQVDDCLTAHLAGEAGLREAVAAADAALAQACTDVDGQLAELASARNDAAGRLAPNMLARYERVRQSNGVAVAVLRGPQCTGCHLDLSAAEIDIAKDEVQANGYADCPQCGRMLIV